MIYRDEDGGHMLRMLCIITAYSSTKGSYEFHEEV